MTFVTLWEHCAGTLFASQMVSSGKEIVDDLNWQVSVLKTCFF
jgi:hypothetical protein